MTNHSAIIRDAILGRRSLTTIYESYIRHFTPLVLGKDRSGTLVVVGFQYDGGRPEKLPAPGAWCCFEIARLEGLQTNKHRWNAGPDGGPDIDLAEVEVSASLDR